MDMTTSLSRHRTNHLRNRIKTTSSVTALGLSSPCIRILRKKKTISWPSAGKKTLMESSYLCVLESSVIRSLTRINWNAVDRVFFCHYCRAACHVRSGSEAKISRHVRILSREHLSDSRRPQRHSATYIHPFHFRYTTRLLSSDICHLGEFALVFELRDQSYLWPFGNIVTAMVAPICRDHSTTV